MRSFVACALCLACIFSFSGCSIKDGIQNPLTMYYCNEDVIYNSSEAVISSEAHNGSNREVDPVTLLQLYLKGPNSQDKYCPIPADAIVVSALLEESTIKVVFSKSFAQLSGIDLTIACVCVAKTLMTNYPITQVDISAMDSLLDGQFRIVISQNDFILMDETLNMEE